MRRSNTGSLCCKFPFNGAFSKMFHVICNGKWCCRKTFLASMQHQTQNSLKMDQAQTPEMMRKAKRGPKPRCRLPLDTPRETILLCLLKSAYLGVSREEKGRRLSGHRPCPSSTPGGICTHCSNGNAAHVLTQMEELCHHPFPVGEVVLPRQRHLSLQVTSECL